MFTSNICFIGFLLHVHLRHSQLGVEFHQSDPDSVISTYKNPVPVDVLPSPTFDKSGGGYHAFLYHGTRFQECICFGTNGSFSEPQLEQMAIALEKSNHRFLWSIRKPAPKGTHVPPTDYTNVEVVLPDGFLTRVKGRGMVCGWAPQVEVLAHGATKGFVSHCGWNSILEGLWHGVPIATWPLFAEQQLNAFLLVKELGVGVDLCMTYRSEGNELVMADQIEKAIKCLMDDENPVRNKVKEISEASRNALKNGGSSFVTLKNLVEDMLQDIE